MRVSHKQKEMLAFIENFVEENGYPPTLEEIRVGLEVSSKSLVNHHLEALERANLITRAPNTSRGIRLSHERETVRVPFINGNGFPGANGTIEIDTQEAIELTGDIVPDCSELYAFKINCDSLTDAYVHKGDIVIMQRQKQARNGEMVAIRLIDQEATLLKRYYRENGHVRLQPANPNSEPIFVAPEAVEVQGKVVAVIRQVD